MLARTLRDIAKQKNNWYSCSSCHEFARVSLMSFQLALVQDKNYPQNVMSKGQTTDPVHISWALKKLIINVC
jgi:hypothetical protein